jgi:hypothetical protein
MPSTILSRLRFSTPAQPISNLYDLANPAIPHSLGAFWPLLYATSKRYASSARFRQDYPKRFFWNERLSFPRDCSGWGLETCRSAPPSPESLPISLTVPVRPRRV